MRAIRLLKEAIELAPQKVVDCAVGRGQHAVAFISTGSKVTGVDIGDPKIRHDRYVHIKRSFEVVELRGYDLVWSCHTLEHVTNPGLMLSIFRQWLKPDGWLAIAVPTNQQNRLHVGHLTLWTPAHLMYNLVANGWDCRKAKWYTEYCTIGVLLQKTEDIDLSARTAMPSEREWLQQYMPREVIHEGNAWWENNWHEPTIPRTLDPPRVKAGLTKTDLE